MSKVRSERDLREAVRDRSFVPARAELPAVVQLLGSDEDADAAERALARAGDAGARAAIAAFEDARPPLRGRIVKTVARVPGFERWLLDRLDDEDGKTRRNAIVALGRRPEGPAGTPTEGDLGAEIEERLAASWSQEPRVEHRRSIAASLGKIGDARALEVLRAARDAEDPELRRIVGEALVKLERTAAREERGAIDVAAVPSQPLLVRFRCRRGLEEVLEEELDELSPSVVGPGVIEARAALSIASLYRARTALSFGWVLPVPSRGTVEERVEEAIVAAAPLLRRHTIGPITWRLDWIGAGHRRAATFRVARGVSARRPELRNDPTASLWEIAVIGADDGMSVEAHPKGAADPRFTYRVADVPASSHPTIAAALARASGVRRDEVVWDPFVGAGAELIERARLGACRALYGSDLDPRAIEAARANVAAAGVSAVLAVSDARESRPPEPVSLVITNPPMGRRVLDRRALEPLFEGVFANVRAALRRDGRVVLLSPLFGRSVEMAARHDLRVVRRGAVDLGGFDAELQVFEVRRR
ncbi:MAG: HEAT repeat domain-containing protein [Deltaproteobacteria bacterium]|nr:HEAT repeat domain-containing protein [Deltaproteobacteria bacterium]